MTTKKINESTSKKLEDFIFKNRKTILCVVCVVVVAAAALCVVVGVRDSQNKKGLAAIDKIEFAYTSKAENLSETDIAARQNKVLDDVAAYVTKGGIVGVRANMLAADVYFAKKDYPSALESYLAAAKLGNKMYTAPLCNYNAAVCSEELGKKDEALKYYLEAAGTKDFYLASHALFNAGRIQESLGNDKDAAETYKKAVDGYSNDEWANLCQSRIIDLQVKGKID